MVETNVAKLKEAVDLIEKAALAIKRGWQTPRGLEVNLWLYQAADLIEEDLPVTTGKE